MRLDFKDLLEAYTKADEAGKDEALKKMTEFLETKNSEWEAETVEREKEKKDYEAKLAENKKLLDEAKANVEATQKNLDEAKAQLEAKKENKEYKVEGLLL